MDGRSGADGRLGVAAVRQEENGPLLGDHGREISDLPGHKDRRRVRAARPPDADQRGPQGPGAVGSDERHRGGGAAAAAAAAAASASASAASSAAGSRRAAGRPAPSTPFDPSAAPVVAPVPTAAGPLQSTPLLRPFPTVRIRGRLTLRGAQVTLLVVRSPRGAIISARCRGKGCPVRRLTRTASSRTRLRSLERVLRAGTRLDITVTRAGYIGKWTTIIIRRGYAPWRADRCVKPGRSRPSPCPAA